MTATTLQVDGCVARPVSLSIDDFQGIDAGAQIADVSELDPKRKGQGVWLRGFLDLVQPTDAARYITFHASHDDFAASVPLADVRERGAIVYCIDGEPLDLSAGGPFRFLIEDVDACQVSHLDECANVKFLDRIELTAEAGRDTRPRSDAEHEALHDHDHS